MGGAAAATATETLRFSPKSFPNVWRRDERTDPGRALAKSSQKIFEILKVPKESLTNFDVLINLQRGHQMIWPGSCQETHTGSSVREQSVA